MARISLILILIALSLSLLAGCKPPRPRVLVPQSCYEKGCRCGCSNLKKHRCFGKCCSWTIGLGCRCRLPHQPVQPRPQSEMAP